MRFAANISLMYGEADFADRPALARDDGFTAVECWWPFPGPTPSAAELHRFLDGLARADLTLTALNFFAGDMAAGDRGILSDPGADEAFAANLDALVEIARETGCCTFNALYGHRLPRYSPREQDAVAIDRLRVAADRLAPFGGVIVLESLTHGQNGPYPLVTLDDSIRAAASAGRDGVKVLFDVFHLHNNGADMSAELRARAPHVGHIQIADSPGRGRPGTGAIDFVGFYDAVEAVGYDGWIGCEYREARLRGVPTRASLVET
jgi:hydroxypyruvate isomerase